MPKITVFMAVYNAELHLKEAIESVLAQSYSDFELLIIDDGSEDDSIAIIEEYKDSRIRLVKNEVNMGIPYTRNRGLKLAKGDYFAILDSDDIAKPDRLKKQISFLNKRKEYVAVASRVDYICDEKYINKKNYPGYRVVNYELVFRNVITNSSAMFDMRVIRENQIAYNNSYFAGEDYAFWVELSKYGKIAVLNTSLTEYRIGTAHNHITNTNIERQNQWKKINCRIKDEYLQYLLSDYVKNDGIQFNALFTMRENEDVAYCKKLMKRLIRDLLKKDLLLAIQFVALTFVELKKNINLINEKKRKENEQ